MKISFSVVGEPAPQGSKRNVGHGIMIEASKAVKPWREAVKWAAVEAIAGRPRPLLGSAKGAALFLEVEFFLRRPKSVKDKYPGKRPDIDKLLRSTMDALTQAGVYRDDSQVVDTHMSKRYADSTRSVGAYITVEEL